MFCLCVVGWLTLEYGFMQCSELFQHLKQRMWCIPPNHQDEVDRRVSVPESAAAASMATTAVSVQTERTLPATSAHHRKV